jgi:UDP-3-O-[3-hydroxymyristoyl] N-acetylglucosamine deacetylase/3-hydroxyacyl-[acyl-carrier-protein] dehydratase
VTFQPAPAGTGIVFRRTDEASRPEIPASLHAVSSVERRTALGEPPVTIHTVEHLLAAVAALAIDDLVVELDGPEPPIGDGSFLPYLEALTAADPVETDGEASVLRIAAPFTVTEGDASYVIAPAKGLTLTVTVEWPHPLIGSQAGTFEIDADTFRAELAGARTFGFAHEAEALRAKGLIQGATAANAIVLTDDGLAEGSLRWPDEFVRHKAGDLLGDLALTGARVEALVVARRPSHAGNVALARAIKRAAQRSGPPAVDIGAILSVIPHRYPMLLVDRIVEVDGRDRIVGVKNVTINEPFFQGHFPGHPIMPGVLIIEAMAQVGGMLLMGQFPDAEDKVVYFMSLDNVKFRRPVIPGDQIRFELEMVQFRGRTCRMRGVGYVDGSAVAEADMMARVMDR